MRPDSGARALKTLAQQITETQAVRIDVVILPDGRNVLDPLARRQTAENKINVFAAAKIVTVRTQLGREASDPVEHFTAHAQIAAAWYRAVISNLP